MRFLLRLFGLIYATAVDKVVVDNARRADFIRLERDQQP